MLYKYLKRYSSLLTFGETEKDLLILYLALKRNNFRPYKIIKKPSLIEAIIEVRY